MVRKLEETLTLSLSAFGLFAPWYVLLDRYPTSFPPASPKDDIVRISSKYIITLVYPSFPPVVPEIKHRPVEASRKERENKKRVAPPQPNNACQDMPSHTTPPHLNNSPKYPRLPSQVPHISIFPHPCPLSPVPSFHLLFHCQPATQPNPTQPSASVASHQTPDLQIPEIEMESLPVRAETTRCPKVDPDSAEPISPKCNAGRKRAEPKLPINTAKILKQTMKREMCVRGEISNRVEG